MSSYRDKQTANTMDSHTEQNNEFNELNNNENDDEESELSSNSDDYSDDGSDSNSDAMSEVSSDEVIAHGRFNLVTVCVYNSKVHGSPECDGHYLVYSALMQTNYYTRRVLHNIKEMNAFYSNRVRNHRFIRNYKVITNSQTVCSPQIAECIYLPGGEHVAIIKTMYIRLIQRAWKKVYAMRVSAAMKKLHPTNILHRLARGTWPECCTNLPTIRGILSYMCINN